MGAVPRRSDHAAGQDPAKRESGAPARARRAEWEDCKRLGMQGRWGFHPDIMLRKFIARLRESIAPAPKKPAQVAPQPAAPARRPGPAAGGRPHGQGQRGQGRGPSSSHGGPGHGGPGHGGPGHAGQGQGGQAQGGAPQARQGEFRPRHDERRPRWPRPPEDGAGPARATGRRPRPARDDFEHPGSGPVKPARPRRRPEDGHALLQARPHRRPCVRRPGEGLHRADADPGPGDPADPRGPATSSAPRRRARARPPRSRSRSSSAWAATGRCAA